MFPFANRKDGSFYKTTISGDSEIEKISIHNLTNQNRVFENLKIIDFTKSDHKYIFLVTISNNSRRNITWIKNTLKSNPELKSHKPHIFEEQNEFYIGTENGLSRTSFSGETTWILPNIWVTSVTRDKEDLLWVTTLNNGVFVISALDILSISLEKALAKNEKLTTVAPFYNKIFTGTNQANIFQLSEKGKLEKIHSKSKKISRHIKDLFISKDGTSLFYCDFLLKHVNGDFYTMNIPYDREGLTTLNFPGQTQDFISNAKLDSLLLANIQYGKISNTVTLDSTLYFLLNDDLHRVTFSDTSFHLVDLSPKNGNKVIVRKLRTVGDTLLIATKGHGIFLMKNSKILLHLTTKDGLVSDMVNDLLQVNNKVWVATNKGLSIINLGDSIGDDKKVISLTSLDGLFSNYIENLAMSNGKVACISTQGLTIIHVGFKLNQRIPPKILIQNVRVNNSIDISSGQTLNHDENNIEFSFAAVGLKKPKSPYKYRLLLNNDTGIWNFTDERNIWIRNLSHGNFTFEVCAKGSNTFWSKPATFNFEITQRFIDKAWVRGLGILLLLILISLFLFLRYRRVLKANKIELDNRDLALKVSHLESDALRNQMNPHFIFNALNSIQKLVLNQETDKANHLLTEFSSLIRSSLKYSRLEFIPLTDEMSFLKTYLGIEKQRHPERFSYTLLVEDELNQQDILVPPLLIQPLCENAVKHAFQNNNGTISVTFSANDENTIKVTIQDDGIGILNQEARKTNNHLGMKIVTDRLSLFRDEGYATGLNVKPYNNKTQKGTIITLIIPIEF